MFFFVKKESRGLFFAEKIKRSLLREGGGGGLDTPGNSYEINAQGWKKRLGLEGVEGPHMIYKSLNDLVPGYLFTKFVKRYETRYSLRDSVSITN